MKQKTIALFFLILFFITMMTQCQPVREVERPRPDRPPQPAGAMFRPGDLKVLELEMSPDPVREGQGISFRATLDNVSRHANRVNLFIKDRDEVITVVRDVTLRPGHNRVLFPRTNYRFSRQEHCFTVVVDVERTMQAIDLVKSFCVRRSAQGWTLGGVRVGPLFVMNLDMTPDPVSQGQDVRFRVRLRNDGVPLRADLRIHDRDQVVARLNDVTLARGHSDFLFPWTRYVFQRSDHCFTVIVDVEKTSQRVDSAKEFCAKPKGRGWSLKP
jgi:hypothetical protein